MIRHLDIRIPKLTLAHCVKEKGVITTSHRFKCVPQILGSSSTHMFRNHERNSFDLGEISLKCVSNFVTN